MTTKIQQIASSVPAPRDDYNISATQTKVLAALGVTANGWRHANNIFEAIGIHVEAQRQGRSYVPVVTKVRDAGGGFNSYGEGDAWNKGYTADNLGVDLSPVTQWMES